jgi:hypothetical protein
MKSVAAAPRRASGRWLAPLLIASGVAIAAVGVWFMLHARPTPGAYYEVFAMDDRRAVALRHEEGTERSFLELLEIGRGVRWQALIPPYAGTPSAPGIAASPAAITVRVRREGKDWVWALSTEDDDKLGEVGLYPGPPRAGAHPPAVVTVSDETQAFEFTGDDAHSTSITAIRLADGHPQWRVDIGQGDVASAWLCAPGLCVATPDGTQIVLDRATGERLHAHAEPTQAAALAGLKQSLAGVAWPADAIAPQVHHARGSLVWVAMPDRVGVVDLATKQVHNVAPP